MSKDAARQFYSTSAWQKCRKAYMASVHYLCEDCLAKGKYTPAEIVHHVIPLTPDNLSDPKITTGFDNLKAVCRECHAEEHGAHIRRYRIMPDGSIEIK